MAITRGARGWASRLSIAGAAAVLAATGAVAQTDPPNILLILADDNPWSGYGFMLQLHQSDPEGCMYRREAVDGCQPKNKADLFADAAPDFQQQITPSIDRLARQGIVFPVAHAGSSVCMPSFQATMTGRYERDFKRFDRWRVDNSQAVLPEGPVYYLPEFLNEALRHVPPNSCAEATQASDCPSGDCIDGRCLCDDSTDCGRNGYCDGQQRCVVRYRSFGMSKIWTVPEKEPSGFTNHGFDCGLRERGQARYTIDPIVQFVRGTRNDPTDYQQADDPSPGHPLRGSLGSWPKQACAAPAWNQGAPAPRWDEVRNPWFVLYSPNLPHVPTDGEKLTRARGNPAACDFGDANDCIFIPLTDDPDHDGPEWAGSRLEALLDRMKRVHADDLRESSYLTNLMFLDYWIGELMTFLETEDDARYCDANGQSCTKKLIETTLVIYQSDNGYQLPGSKATRRENGFRTPIIVREPAPASNPTGPPIVNRALASALDIVPSAVDYATGGAVSYRTCAAGRKPPADSPFAVEGTACVPLPGASPDPDDPDGGCGCLPGKSFRQPASFGRNELYGERRNSAGGITSASLRLRAPRAQLPGLGACKEDDDGRCHIRIERTYPTSSSCTLKVYDVLADPDSNTDLMKDGGWTQSGTARNCWNARLNQFVRSTETCGSPTSCACGGSFMPCT